MPSLQREPTGYIHVVIRRDRRRYKRSLGTKSEARAILDLEDIEATIELVDRGRLAIPDGVCFIDFVLAKGDTSKLVGPESPVRSSLGEVIEEFFDELPELDVSGVHITHHRIPPLLQLNNPTRFCPRKQFGFTMMWRCQLQSTASGANRDRIANLCSHRYDVRYASSPKKG